MTSVLVEKRDDEHLGADAVSGGSRGDGRQLLESAELRDGGRGYLQRLELSFEQTLAPRPQRRLGVKPLHRPARA